jgi:pimeloyl-ACP methyl ester carboxylesterase
MESANLTDYLLNGGYDIISAFAQQCASDNAENGQYISSAFVARDMLQIVDALGEDGLLHYWGSSYGTTLGQVFAAMFPDRVGRMVLDAVANAKAYTEGYWIDSILDTTKSYRGFLRECLATPDSCALAQFVGPDTTPAALEQRIDDALADLPEADSLYSVLTPYEPPTGPEPSPVTKYDVKDLILQSLYSVAQWPMLDTGLVALLNGTIGPEHVGAASASSSPPTDPDVEPYNLGTHAIYGIMCSDSQWRAPEAPEAMVPIVAAQTATSDFADIFYQGLTWPCAPWGIETKERYDGDYAPTQKTRDPLLFVHTEHDPVCSVAGAQNATAGFEGSVLLMSKGFGVSFSFSAAAVPLCLFSYSAHYVVTCFGVLLTTAFFGNSMASLAIRRSVCLMLCGCIFARESCRLRGPCVSRICRLLCR